MGKVKDLTTVTTGSSADFVIKDKSDGTATEKITIANLFAIINTTATCITAYAGGGQANATQLSAKYNTVSTVASGGDSVKLPSATASTEVFIINGGGATLRVYPQTGEYINGVVNDFAQLGSSYVGSGHYVCISNGYWGTF